MDPDMGVGFSEPRSFRGLSLKVFVRLRLKSPSQRPAQHPTEEVGCGVAKQQSYRRGGSGDSSGRRP